MKNTIERLAYLRHNMAEQKNMLAGAEAALRSTVQWAEVEHRRERLRATEMEEQGIETEVRNLALAAYGKTGDKAPHPAVKVKMYTVLDYEDADAFDYAREHLPQALTLNKKVFETAAKSIKLDFVVIQQEPRATIARDLSGYLPEG